MKKTFFLTAFTLQCSLFCFSQTDSMNHYTGAEIEKLVKYKNELENKNPTFAESKFLETEKKKVDQLLNDHKNNAYTDLEVIKLVKYIQTLEKANVFVSVSEEENAIDKE